MHACMQCHLHFVLLLLVGLALPCECVCNNIGSLY